MTTSQPDFIPISQGSRSLSSRARVALVAILFVAAVFRLLDLNWDQNQHLHPDERFIVMVTMDRIGLPFPNLEDAHLGDPRRSTLNPRSADPGTGQPRNFAYGSLPLYLLKFSGHLLSTWWPQASGFDGLTLLGRVWSALFDLGTVFLVFLIGRRLYGGAAGLLAALLLGLTVLSIQLSHFYASDTLLTFFVTATLFLGLRVVDRPSVGRVALMGAAAGLAMACKASAAPVLAACLLACLVARHEGRLQDAGDRIARALPLASLALLTAGAVFFLFQPYLLLDPQPFLRDIQFEGDMVRGVQIPPYTIQYLGTEPVLYQLRNLFLWTAGPALCLATLGGLGFFGLSLLRRRSLGEWVLAAWLVPYLAITLSFQVKFARYMLPVLPVLVVLAAAWLISLGRRRTDAGIGEGEAAVARPRWAAAAILVVVAGTALQAMGFVDMYRGDHTRVEASRWIYQNVPKGAAIATEHWDDSLPLNLAGGPGRPADYRNVTLPLYDGDSPNKLRDLVLRLEQADYIVLSSNRLYGSISRVPESYPMSSTYYSLLLQGRLGFESVATFTSYPGIGPMRVVDDGADESFTVYDHPKVLVFKKGPDYSAQKVLTSLGAVPLDRIVPVKQLQAGRNGLMLTESRREVESQGGTWSRLYDPSGVANRFPTFTWWLVLESFGLLALPVAWRVFARLPDRGYGLSKVLGLLVVGYVAWLLPSLYLLPFGRLSIVAGILLLGLASLVVLRRHWAAFREYFGAHRRVILAHELLFLGAFTLFWLIRVRNPDLWHLNFGGEKPMEFAFLNAVGKSTYFPPYDPWMAGGYINYYYFGYVLVATVMRLTGIVPAVAFNLAIPSFFALTAAGLFSFGLNYALTSRRADARALTGRPVLAGLTAVGFVLIVGNLDGLIQILESMWKLGGLQVKSALPLMEGTLKAVAGILAILFGGKSLQSFDFWRSTRIIGPENPTPITEFPYFTYLYGDLHPHMMAMPLATLALGLVLAVVRQGAREREGGSEFAQPKPVRSRIFSRAERAMAVTVGGLVVGALQVTNSWDYPTYLALLSAGFLLGAVTRDRGVTWNGIVESMVSAVAVYAVAQLLFLPFHRSYELFYNGVDSSKGKTSLQHYLVIWGFFLFCIGSMLAHTISRSRRHRLWLRGLWARLRGSPSSTRRDALAGRLIRPAPWVELLRLATLGIVGLILLAILWKQFLVAILLGLGLLALWALPSKGASPEKSLLILFVGLGLLLTLGVEFVTIKGDIGRMNTVFKFYLQAWFLFGLAAALGISEILSRRRESGPGRTPWWYRCWAVALATLLMSVLIYPLAATRVKVELRFNPTVPSVNGMAYMESASFRDQNRDIILSRDYRALRWMQEQVAESPVVLEAQVPEYRWGSRVSIYTGLPTVLGWTWHERQQRWGYQWMIEERLRDIKTMFDSTDTRQVMALLQKYNVGLIYVGDLERAYYSPAGLAKFEGMVGRGLDVVYSADGVTIFSVK